MRKNVLEVRVRVTLLSSLGPRYWGLASYSADSTTTSPKCGSKKWIIFRENNHLVKIVVGEHLSRRTPEGTKK